jgi:hypothetical protein
MKSQSLDSTALLCLKEFGASHSGGRSQEIPCLKNALPFLVPPLVFSKITQMGLPAKFDVLRVGALHLSQVFEIRTC